MLLIYIIPHVEYNLHDGEYSIKDVILNMMNNTFDINQFPHESTSSNNQLQTKNIAQSSPLLTLNTDNGSYWFFQGDTNKLWNDNDINSLKSIKGSAFEAVDTGSIVH